MAPPKKLVTSEPFEEADAGAETAVGVAGEDTNGAAEGDDLFNGADPKAFDHDGNGVPGGSRAKAGANAWGVASAPTLDQINAMIAEGVKQALAEREAEAARAAAAEPAPGAVIYRSAPPPPAAEGPLVKVRITKTGHGQVHTGKDDPKTYNWQDEVALPRTVAEALEARSFGEILE